MREWYGRARAMVKEQWTQRRKHETLFRLGPSLPGLLSDESPYCKLQTRSQEELTFAEKRVLSDLSFEKIEDGQSISYVKNFMGYTIFADLRANDKIAFYVYESNENVSRGEPSRLSFELHDRFTRELSHRWQTELEKIVPVRKRET